MTTKPKTVPELRFPGFEGEWKHEELESIAAKKISYGIVQAGEHVLGGMPYIKSQDLNKPLALDSLQRTSAEIARKYRRSEVEPGDIVFSLRGNIGVCQIVPRSISVANLTQGTARIAVASHDNRLVAQTLQTTKVAREIDASAKGSTFREISLEALRKISLPLAPTLPEQRKIADFLTAVDGRIGQLSQKKALLEDYKKGVMQQLFTQALRFKDDHGNDFPEWEEKTLRAIASFSKGRGISKADVHENGALPCIRYGELYTHYAELIIDVRSRTNVPKKELVLSQRNDVIIPASGETHIDISTASCVTLDGVALGGDLNIIRTKQNGIFLAYYLNNACKHAIAGMAQGSSVIHLYPDQLKRLRLHLPSVKEQTKIANFLTALDRKIESVSQQITHTQTFKKGLLQQMFV
jgi:type I restriction enzyme S subunit